MPASDDFTKLKEQVEKADEHIRASAAQGVDELKAMVDRARTNVSNISGAPTTGQGPASATGTTGPSTYPSATSINRT